VAGGEARLRTRSGNDWTGSFPAIAAALEKLKVRDVVLDMEAVILDAEGKSSFQALQAALGDGGRPERIVAYVFDLLHLDGESLVKQSLTERKKKLEALFKKSKLGAACAIASTSPLRARRFTRRPAPRDWKASSRNLPVRRIFLAGRNHG
jgi:ATP-dependent DNA ligase